MVIISKDAQHDVGHSAPRIGSKKLVQQGPSQFYARSVHAVREHGKLARTLLAAFFNRPTKDLKRVFAHLLSTLAEHPKPTRSAHS